MKKILIEVHKIVDYKCKRCYNNREQGKSYALTDAIIETIKVEMLNAFHYVIIIANKEKSYALTDAIIETKTAHSI